MSITSSPSFVYSRNLVWDTNLLDWVSETQPGGGGGGGAVTVADGADVTQGAIADAAWSGTGSGTVVSVLKKIASSGTGGGPATIADGADVAEGAKADTAWSGTGSGSVIGILKAVYGLLTGTLKVDGSGVTQPVSGSVSVSNFPGTQPVSGTVTVQQSTAANLKVDLSGTGANATAVKVDGSGVTQPVSLATLPALTAGSAVIGHVIVDTAPTTAVTNAGLSNLDVLLSTRLKPADTLTKVATVDTITNPVAVTGTFFQATQPVSAAALPLPSNAAQETGGNLATIATNTTGASTAANQATELAYLTTIINNQVEYETNLLRALIMEMRILNAQIREGLNLRDEIDTYRIDPYFNTQVN